MQLFIMRHGQAESFSSSDSARNLTELGRYEVSIMAKWLLALPLDISHVLVSPYIRAQQTAETILSILQYNVAQETLPLITPMGSAQEVHDYLDGISNDKKITNLLMVSHMPLVSYLVEELTCDKKSPIFQTAGIAHIDYDEKKMTGKLLNIISPTDCMMADK